MVGSSRNDTVITNALAAMAQVLAHAQKNEVQGQQHEGSANELRLDRFMRNHPLTVKGKYDPDGALTWLQGIESVFRAMVTNNQKLRLAAHMLAEEAKFLWMNACWRLEPGGATVSWTMFKEEFLRKYFPADVRNKKEIEFLYLKRGSMSVAEYAAKFE